MSDTPIPADVMEAAEALWGDVTLSLADAVEVLARALLSVQQAATEAERRRCAEIARTFPERVLVMWERPGGPPGNGTRLATGADIADRILSGDHT